ncbi:MAG: sensor histidine kinase [Saprospiraceae bacterium]|nr:sensor histidine kinase [Saprospiraceae bacterium]
MNKILKWIFLLLCLLALRLTEAKSADSLSVRKDIMSLIRDGLTAQARSEKDGLNHFEAALRLSDSLQMSDLSTIIHIEQARMARQKLNVKTFLSELKKAEPYIMSNDSAAYADEYYALWAQYHYFMKDYPRALEWINKAEEVRDRMSPFRNWKTYNFKSMIYEAMGENQKARSADERAELLARLQNTSRTLDDLDRIFDDEAHAAEIEKLSLQNRLIQVQANNARKQKQNLRIVIGLISLLFATSMAFLISRTRSNKRLKEMNSIVSENLKEKDLLIQEIHHRVKNNLQLISSLLSLQSRTVNDEKASLALSEGQSRVLSMALIHQNLYKDKVSSGMDVQDYVQQLTQRLLATYGIKPENIELSLDIDPIALDVATLVPLGLIINELIANALKYAFEENQKGKIEMTLKQKDGDLLLKLKDDGKGFPSIGEGDGFGMKLIRALSKKLDADLNVSNDNGASIEMLIKNFKLAI